MCKRRREKKGVMSKLSSQSAPMVTSDMQRLHWQLQDQSTCKSFEQLFAGHQLMKLFEGSVINGMGPERG